MSTGEGDRRSNLADGRLVLKRSGDRVEAVQEAVAHEAVHLERHGDAVARDRLGLEIHGQRAAAPAARISSFTAGAEA